MNELTHSKTYKYELGHTWFKATTVAELAAFLAQFPGDMPVIVEWEGTAHSLTHPEVKGFDGEGDALVFNAEFDIA